MAAEFARCCALWAEATAFRARQARELEGMAARGLHRALSSMGPDTDVAARAIILTPCGDLAGVVVLSHADTECLRLAAEASAEAHAADPDQMISDLQAFLAEGGES